MLVTSGGNTLYAVAKRSDEYELSLCPTLSLGSTHFVLNVRFRYAALKADTLPMRSLSRTALVLCVDRSGTQSTARGNVLMTTHVPIGGLTETSFTEIAEATLAALDGYLISADDDALLGDQEVRDDFVQDFAHLIMKSVVSMWPPRKMGEPYAPMSPLEYRHMMQAAKPVAAVDNVQLEVDGNVVTLDFAAGKTYGESPADNADAGADATGDTD